MSGHSKWATIHRQKEVKDAKRGAVFTKLAAAIMVAVKEGGGIGDPDKNFKLRLAVDRARQLNMPKENISRAIDKGMGSGGEGDLSEVNYEGFLPGGCAVMILVVTDNKARTSQQVRSVLEKHGGSLGGSGAVGYMFMQMGEIRVMSQTGEGKDVQDQELEIIDMGGVEDLVQDGSEFIIYCPKEKMLELRSNLEEKGYTIESFELVMKPESLMEVNNAELQAKIEATIEALEDLDDVSHVFSNYHPG